MICCGKERDTNFCPDCGTPLGKAAGESLLAHLQYQAKRLSTRKDVKNRDMSTKYETWSRWVQEQLDRGASVAGRVQDDLTSPSTPELPAEAAARAAKNAAARAGGEA